VSVSSQADTERADLERERRELDTQGERELDELAWIYVNRGLEPPLAREVAQQLMAHDALGAHARDELGISAALIARPGQAALASAGAFALGAALPLLAVAAVPLHAAPVAVAVASLGLLALLGLIGARAGGAPLGPAALRVTLWGALAMATTAGIGALIGTVV
jgi:VIT1/CCC1 family predicted Fe2+/Mn2+ transporter